MALDAAQLSAAKQIVGYLIAPTIVGGGAPFPLNSAFGWAGNCGQESSFNPVAVGDGGASKYGWQWQATRLNGPNGVETWCHANNLDVTTWEAQCAFLRWEFPQQVDKTVQSWIYDTSNNGQPARRIETLAADECIYFERPNPQYADLTNRENTALAVAAAYVPSNPTSPPAQPPSPPMMPPMPPSSTVITLPNAQINANIAQVMSDLAIFLKSIQGL